MENWEIVRVVGNEEEATVVAGFLRSSGVPAEVESRAFTEMPVNFGDLGEVRILVPAEQLQEALTLLDERDAAEPAPEPGSAPAAPSPVEPE